MSDEKSRAEVQLCVTAKNLRKPSFTKEDLRGFGEVIFKDELQDWSDELNRLTVQNIFRVEGESYALTEAGGEYIEKVVASEFFGRMLVRAEQSQAFGQFCERAYGRNLAQFGTADMGQIEKLISVLNLNEQSRALDVACGIGTLTEYISDITGAKITGIDLAEPAIERAIERTGSKADRLNFILADINNLTSIHDRFDTVISIDTLYFAKDLKGTIGQLQSLLKPDGQMGLFYSAVRAASDPPEILEADRTVLAQALKSNELSYEAYDLTESNLAFWERSQKAIEEVRGALEAEGNKDLSEGRIVEGNAVLGLALAGKMTRYLYHVRV
jgi:2-polyprenyl-3-methyl-5-hydroxy-6-metoxy-1,4-benzoquinol methylase